MASKKLPTFVLLITLCSGALSTKEPTNLLNAGQQFSLNHPFMDVTDHHIATVHFLESKDPNRHIDISVKTYSLQGQELKSCSATVPLPKDSPPFSAYTGNLISLGNNETLVIYWIQYTENIEPSYKVSVSTINTSNCKFTLDEFVAFTIEHPSLKFDHGTDAYIVPYDDSFDVIFKNQQGKIVKTRYGANGLVIKNPVELAETESSSILSTAAISKYSESKGYLAFYLLEKKDLTAVLINSDAKTVKRHTLLQVPADSRVLFKNFGIIEKNDHGKLVICNTLTKTVKCTRYNVETLESEISTEIEFKEVQLIGEIEILPDGGFWIWSMKSYGDEDNDSKEYVGTQTSSLTKVDAHGHVKESFEKDHCNLALYTKPHLYYANGKICFAHMCQGEKLSNNTHPYSTKVICY